MDQNLPRFPTTPYRPEGGFTTFGFLLLLLASLLAGMVLGVLAGFVSRWIYLILIFPVLIGLGVGAAGYLAIRVGKVRNVTLGSMSGLLGGFFAMVSMHYLGYQIYRIDEPPDPNWAYFQRSLTEMTPEEIRSSREVMDYLVRTMRAHPDYFKASPDWPEARAFQIREGLIKAMEDPLHRAELRVIDLWSFMQFKATAGVVFKGTRSGDASGGMNLGYIGSWVYWFVEVVVVALIALGIQSLAAKEPFCRRCQNWKPQRQLGILLEEDLNALREGDLPHFASPAPEGENGSMVAVKASICEGCRDQSPVDLFPARLVVTNEGVMEAPLEAFTYPGEALPYLEKIFRARPAENVPPAEEPRTE